MKRKIVCLINPFAFLLPAFTRIAELPGSVHDALYKERKIKMDKKRFEVDSATAEHNKKMDTLKLEFEKYKFNKEMEYKLDEAKLKSQAQEKNVERAMAFKYHQLERELDLRRDEVELRKDEVELRKDEIKLDQLKEQRYMAELLHTKRLGPRRYAQISRDAGESPERIVQALLACAKDRRGCANTALRGDFEAWCRCYSLVLRWRGKHTTEAAWLRKPLPSPFELKESTPTPQAEQAVPPVSTATTAMSRMGSQSSVTPPFASATLCAGESKLGGWVLPVLVLALLASYSNPFKPR